MSGVNWIRAKSRPSTARERACEEGLAEPGQVLEQDVATREDPDHHELQRGASAHDRPIDLVEDRVAERCDLRR